MLQLLSVVISDIEFIRLCDYTLRPLGAAQISAEMEGIQKGLSIIDATCGVNTISSHIVKTQQITLCIKLIRTTNKSYII